MPPSLCFLSAFPPRVLGSVSISFMSPFIYSLFSPLLSFISSPFSFLFLSPIWKFYFFCPFHLCFTKFLSFYPSTPFFPDCWCFLPIFSEIYYCHLVFERWTTAIQPLISESNRSVPLLLLPKLMPTINLSTISSIRCDEFLNHFRGDLSLSGVLNH